MFKWPWTKDPSPPVAQKRGGVFSTELRVSDASPIPFLQDLMARSIKRTIADTVVVNAEGVVLDSCEWDENFVKPAADFIQSIPGSQLGWYASQGFIGYQICAIIAQHWLVDKACSMPARDAIRHGYELATVGDVKVENKTWDFIKKQDKKFGIKRQVTEFIRMGRVFGIRVAMPVVEYMDPKALEKPFNIDGVMPGSFKGFSQIDPYWIAPELDGKSASDPASMHFYEPTWWRINGMRVHRTHLIIFRNGEVPDLLKPTYLYGGIPVPQKVAERIYAAERTANEAPALSLSKRTTSVKVNDIEAAIADQSKFDQRMLWWTQTRDNYGVKILGEGEELEQFDTSLADFDATIMTQYQLVAAAANVPATKLLGTSPKGFNSTGEFEADSYHEELETIQSNDMEPFLTRYYQLLMKSVIIPSGIAPFEIAINWNPVDSPSAKESADLNLSKAQTDDLLVGMGALEGQDVRDRLVKDKDSGYNGITPAAPDPMEEILPENIHERIGEEGTSDGKPQPT